MAPFDRSYTTLYWSAQNLWLWIRHTAGYAAERFDTVSLQHERDRRTAARQHRPRLRIATKTAYGTSFSFEKVTARPHEHVSVVKI